MSRPQPDPHVQLLDDARQAEAIEDRSRRRLLSEVDEQDATFRGSLEAQAEAQATVVLETTVDHRIRGLVRSLAARHVVVDGDHGRAWIRLDCVTTLRTATDPPARATGGERSPRQDLALADAIRDLAEQRAEIDVLFVDGSLIRGAAHAVGTDVLTLRTAAGKALLVSLPQVAIITTRTP